MEKKTLGVIPARFASTRFPGKPLIDLGGKSMIMRVYEQACKSTTLHSVIVATDDARIFDHVVAHGGKAIMTSSDHATGTDRCSEVALRMPEFHEVVNIQGDEPFIRPEQIDAVVFALRQISLPIATLVKSISDPVAIHNPNTVKALIRNHEAIYFSRSALPFVRGVAPKQWAEYADYYKHIGIYAYERETLLNLSTLPPGGWEKAESLEQLRWLEAGYRIAIGITDFETIGIDTPEDVEKVAGMF